MSFGTRFFSSHHPPTEGSNDGSSSDDSKGSLSFRQARRERVRASDLPVLERSHSGRVGKGRQPNPLTKFDVPSNQRPVLCLDRPMEQTKELHNFRSTAQVPDSLDINRVGLEALHLSGSASIASKANAKALIQHAKEQGCQLVVINKRAEPHAIANDEVPLTLVGVNNWLGWGKEPAELQNQQDQWINKLSRKGRLLLKTHGDVKKAVKPFKTLLHRPKITSEKDLFESVGKELSMDVLYFPDSAVDDLCRPTRAQADEGIKIAHSLQDHPSSAPNGYWVHEHCKGGCGRTLTAMIEKDCLENAHQVSFEDIVRRQCLLAGKDENCLKEKANNPNLEDWRKIVVEERWIYLQSYYEYAKANPRGRPMLYSEWRESDAISDAEAARAAKCANAPALHPSA